MTEKIKKVSVTDVVTIAKNFVFKQEVSEKRITELQKKYEVLPDANTVDGYEFIRLGLADVRTTRTTVEKHSKSIKDPLNSIVKQINSVTKDITGRLQAIEQPMKDAKKVVDDEKERQKLERERIKAVKIMAMEVRVNNEIRNAVIEAVGKSSKEIDAIGARINAIDPQSYEGREMSAQEAQEKALSTLGEMHDKAYQFEKDEAVRLEAERLKKIEDDKVAEINRLAQEKLDAERKAFEKEKAELEALRNEQQLKEKLDNSMAPEIRITMEDGVLTDVQESAAQEPILEPLSDREADIQQLQEMIDDDYLASVIYEDIESRLFKTIGVING